VAIVVAVAAWCAAVPGALGAAGPSVAARPAAFDHSVWTELLQKHVDEGGRVAYRNLAAQDGAKFERYLDQLAEARPEALPTKEALAFYINAYNAFAVEGVLEGLTAESILSRARFFKLKSSRLAGREVTLEEIEQKLIRPNFSDARIHFALVCASASCPRLARRAYTGENLDAMLEDQGRWFLADRARNPLGIGNVVTVSSIFDWYESDFRAAAGSVQAFIARYAGPSGAACLQKANCTLQYARYDWTLNAQPGLRP
jgi:hypothetical protein